MLKSKPADLTPEEIAAGLRPFGVRLPDEQLIAIQRYIDILLLWNERLSLTAVTDPTEIVSRHFGESIFAGSLTDLSYGRLADLGTGAGFPGLALKIAFPELRVTLIESNSKKTAFLHEIVGQLGMQGVEIVRGRYEGIPTAELKFDFVCSRALGDYRNLLNWSRESLKLSGAVVFWLGEEESIKVGQAAGWQWQVPKLIPGSKKRVVMIGTKAG